MKRATIFAILSIIVLIGTNVYYFFNAYQKQIESHKTVAGSILEICTSKTEQEIIRLKTGSRFLLCATELEYAEVNHQLPDFTAEKIKQYFRGYQDYLVEINISENTGRMITINRDNTDSIQFFTIGSDAGHSKLPKEGLFNTHVMLKDSLHWDNNTYIQTEIVIDIKSLFTTVSRLFRNNDNAVYWITDDKFTPLNYDGDISIAEVSINNFDKYEPASGFSQIHTIQLQGENVKVLSVFHPLTLDENNYYLISSIPASFRHLSAFRNNYIVGILSLLIIITTIILFNIHIRTQHLEKTRIKQSEGALKKVLHYLPSGVVLVNKHQEILEVNNAAQKMFQLEDPDMLTGQVFNEFQLFAKLRIIEKKTVSTSGLRYIISDNMGNQRVIFNEKIPFFLYSEKYTIESFYEMTPVVDSQGAHRTEFLTNISHELRTPLNGIIGMTNLLLNSRDLPDKEKEMVNVAKRSALTLLNLITDILDFSRLEAGKFEIESIPYNLKEEIQNIVNDFAPLARDKKINISTDFSDFTPGELLGDPVRVSQVLSNLLNNAIKFTPHGVIIISVTPGKTISGGEAVQISIKDSGIGIKPEKIKTIFEPFWQADQSSTRDFGGSGLGTTISKQLVTLMGGEIWANSPSGISSDPKTPGSEFCFSLPLKTKKYQKNFYFTDIISFTQIKALIVTDDPLHVQVLTRNLIVLGINFEVLPPVTETLEKIRNANHYHLLIIDHRFDLNGLEFLQEMHNHRLHTKNLIILQSNDSHATNTNVARYLGADVFLRKPIPLTTLKQTIIRYFPNLANREKTEKLSIPESLNILVIDNNHLNHKITENLLRKLGYNATHVSGIEEAIAHQKNNLTEMILLDTFLPPHNMVSSISILRKEKISCPIIIIGSEQDITEDIRERYLTAGANDILAKPVDMNNINYMIAKWMSAQR